MTEKSKIYVHQPTPAPEDDTGAQRLYQFGLCFLFLIFILLMG